MSSLPQSQAIPTTSLLVKVTEEITLGYPLTILVPHKVEALLNSLLTLSTSQSSHLL